MFLRNYLGLEFTGTELRAVSIRRDKNRVAFIGGGVQSVDPGVFKPDFMQPQIQNPDIFTTAVQDVLSPLAKREKRIAVALPNESGRQFLLEFDAPFKNYNEGLGLVRWRLKGLLPSNLEQYRVDYQPVINRMGEMQRVLVSVVANEVLSQYEELLSRAGFNPALIDFQCLNLYSAYRSKIDLNDDFFLISLDHQQFSFIAFVDQCLNLCRTKIIESNPATIFKELNRSVSPYRKNQTLIDNSKIYLHCQNTDTEDLLEILSAIFEQPVELLSSPFEQCTVQPDHFDVNDYDQKFAASFGVAERMIKRVRQ